MKVTAGIKVIERCVQGTTKFGRLFFPIANTDVYPSYMAVLDVLPMISHLDVLQLRWEV